MDPVAEVPTRAGVDPGAAVPTAAGVDPGTAVPTAGSDSDYTIHINLKPLMSIKVVEPAEKIRSYRW